MHNGDSLSFLLISILHSANFVQPVAALMLEFIASSFEEVVASSFEVVATFAFMALKDGEQVN